MGDINPNDNENDNGDDDPKGLRAQLAAEQEKNRRLTAENTGFKQADQLRDLGFGHLNQRQRTTLLRDLADEGKDLDEESVTALAKDYGWEKPAGNGGQPDPKPNGDQQQDEVDETEGPLSAIALMQRAGRMSGNTEVSSSFEDEMKKTGSKEELRDLIRTKGPRHGIVHEWDVP